jgi:hypothetical protein
MRIPLLAPERTIFPVHFVGMDLDLYHCPDDLVPVSVFYKESALSGWIDPGLFCVLL